MRKYIWILSLALLIILSLSFTVSSIDLIIDDATKQPEHSFQSFLNDIIKSSLSYLSLVGIASVGLYEILTKKEIPRRFTVISPFVLLVLLFITRLILYYSITDTFICIFLSCCYVGAYLYMIYLWDKSIESEAQPISSRAEFERKICSLIEKSIKGSHTSIKSIQLYSYEEKETQAETEYSINYIGGQVKQGVSINALLSSSVVIESRYLNAVKSIRNYYTKLLYDDCYSEEEQNVIAALITENIEKLKKELNQISSIDSITEKDCYIARIMLVYLSLYATINDHDTYIGLGRDSLGLDDSDIEDRLFTYERTGILGALMFEKMPYVFSYRRNNGKNGRFYYTFSFGNEKKYVIMITLMNKNKVPYIDMAMSNNLTSITNKIIDLSNKYEKKEVGDTNEI